jgi:hypothetical protein
MMNIYEESTLNFWIWYLSKIKTNKLGNMKLNKSPGLDGLTVEFYRAFWGKLKNFLMDIYNKS